jgi:hypothetical protein
MIEPSIGRIVLFRHEGAAPADLPHAAIVIDVASERFVSLACFAPDGTYYHRLNAILLQDDDAPPPEGIGYAEWMPFQKGQAAKYDAAKTDTAAGDIHARLTELENLLKTDGVIHGLFAKVTEDVAAKFHETGAFLEQKFGEIEQRLAHQPDPEPDTPPPSPQEQAAAEAAQQAAQQA